MLSEQSIREDIQNGTYSDIWLLWSPTAKNRYAMRALMHWTDNTDVNVNIIGPPGLANDRETRKHIRTGRVKTSGHHCCSYEIQNDGLADPRKFIIVSTNNYCDNTCNGGHDHARSKGYAIDSDNAVATIVENLLNSDAPPLRATTAAAIDMVNSEQECSPCEEAQQLPDHAGYNSALKQNSTQKRELCS